MGQGSFRWVIWFGLIGLITVFIVYFNLPEPLQVQTVAVQQDKVERTVANTRVGTVKACERSKLSPAIGGQVSKLYVKEGQAVSGGELLLELWNKDRQALVMQAEAMGLFAESERKRICITADADEREASRLSRLLSRKLASEELADQAQSRAQSSRAACASAVAKLDEAQAAIAVARAALEQTYLRAPFAGIVAEVTGEVGEFTTPSPPGVATPPAIDLLTPDCHYVAAPIDEVDAAQVQLGMPVRITMDAFKGQVFNGRVRRIAAYVQDYEKQARTVDVEVDFTFSSNNSEVLIAGYSADVEIVLAIKNDVLRIPSEAVQEDGKVLVLNREGVVERKSVTTGLSNWRYTEVVSGLVQGELVIVSQGRSDIRAGLSAVAQAGAD